MHKLAFLAPPALGSAAEHAARARACAVCYEPLHGGRALRTGDMLSLPELDATASRALPEALRPELGGEDGHVWQVAVLYGPHGAPDFFTGDDIDIFFAHEWEVHYNSSRTGVRLIGPRPEWARALFECVDAASPSFSLSPARRNRSPSVAA